MRHNAIVIVCNRICRLAGKKKTIAKGCSQGCRVTLPARLERNPGGLLSSPALCMNAKLQKEDSHMPELIKDDPVLWFLAAITTGFVAGFSSYRAILAVGAHEIVKKGSYLLKSDVVGKLLRAEALQQLDHLIELGENLDGTKIADAEAYMQRVQTFVHYLDLPVESDGIAGKTSFAEKQIDFTIRDIPNIGQVPRPTPEKVFRIVGVLKGLRASLVSKSGV